MVAFIEVRGPTYKTYGADAVQLISENPYRLASDIRGHRGPHP